jgi:hypothetical protein
MLDYKNRVFDFTYLLSRSHTRLSEMGFGSLLPLLEWLEVASFLRVCWYTNFVEYHTTFATVQRSHLVGLAGMIYQSGWSCWNLISAEHWRK